MYLTKQFSNEENITAHYEATGREIVGDISERIDIIVAGVANGRNIVRYC